MSTVKKASGATGAPLKNYLSGSPLPVIMAAITQSLVNAGARRIAFDYEQGVESAILFELEVGQQRYHFRLPARFDQVEPLLVKSYRDMHRSAPTGDALHSQVRRTAWATIRDWLSAQLALSSWGIAKPEEIFFPFLLITDGESTVFQAFEQSRMLQQAASIVIERSGYE